MSFNLVDLVKNQLGGPALGQLGALLGEDSTRTEAALGAAIPGLLGGLASTANADSGAALFNAVKDADDNLLDDISGLLTGGNSAGVMDQGSHLVSSLLGNDALGGLASAVAGLTGIGGKSSSGLMGILAPVVMGIIKRKLFGGSGFSQNASGLLGMLNGQKNNIEAAMPAGFADQLKSTGFLDQMADFGGQVADTAVSGAASAVSHTAGAVDSASNPAKSGGGLLKKILPVAVVVALALIAWNFIKSKPVADVAETVSGAIPSINIDGTDIGAEFGNIFSSTTSAVTGITDIESATAAIPTLNDITGQVDGLQGLWDKVPEDGRGLIGSLVSDNLSTLTPAIDKVKEIEGVGDVIGPVTGPLLEKLMAFTQ